VAKILVCRCEDVTLRELDEAVERGHDDIESLKRYTGFGTGWCQGKSCVALCARLLEQRTGKAASLPFTPRPPFHPLALADLAGLAEVAAEDEKAGRPPH
jgi:NAD(P)H-nitrite reductase large subunit